MKLAKAEVAGGELAQWVAPQIKSIAEQDLGGGHCGEDRPCGGASDQQDPGGHN